MIGKKISPILEEIEKNLWDFEADDGDKPEYTEEGFRASIKIFMSAMIDKMWEHQDKLSLGFEDRALMGEKLGAELRAIIMAYTGIDSHKIYK